MAVRRPDSLPYWQVTAEGYDSPTEEVCLSWSSTTAQTLTGKTFEELRHVYPLTEWIQRDPERATRVLGNKNTKLCLPEVRLEIWPARVRHTNFQLRAIWKYCNERCWELALYGKLFPPSGNTISGVSD